MAVPVLDALVGKGLLVPVSMFNRMCRSIFTRREGNWNSGWLRAKVLVGGEGSAGLPGAGAERGSTKRGRRDIVYSTEEPAEVTAGGVPWPGAAHLAERVWTEFIQEVCDFPAS